MPKATVVKKKASKKTTKKAPNKKSGRKPGTAYKDGLKESTVYAPKMRLAVKLFEEKLLKNEPFTAVEVLREAGFTENSVQQYSNAMKRIRPHLLPIIEKMESHRDKVMKQMEKKVSKASYGDLVRSLDTLTKNTQLLTGGATENIQVSHSFRERVQHLIP